MTYSTSARRTTRTQVSQKERELVALCASRGLRFQVDTSVTSRHLPKRGNGVIGACTPDLTFRAERIAVFYDGCYWHECPEHFPNARRSVPTERAARQDDALSRDGWTVLRFWEHVPHTEIADSITAAVNTCGAFQAAGKEDVHR